MSRAQAFNCQYISNKKYKLTYPTHIYSTTNVIIAIFHCQYICPNSITLYHTIQCITLTILHPQSVTSLLQIVVAIVIQKATPHCKRITSSLRSLHPHYVSLYTQLETSWCRFSRCPTGTIGPLFL